MTIGQMNEWIGSDSLSFISVEGLHRAVSDAYHDGFCDACFTGSYPTKVPLVQEPAQPSPARNMQQRTKARPC